MCGNHYLAVDSAAQTTLNNLQLQDSEVGVPGGRLGAAGGGPRGEPRGGRCRWRRRQLLNPGCMRRGQLLRMG